MKRLVLAFVILAMVSARPATARPACCDSTVTTLSAQLLDSADYFITPDELRFASEFVAVGRMQLGPLTSRTTEFLVVGPGGGWAVGQRARAMNFYRTRPATARDMEVGKPVFCFNEVQDGVNRAPRDRNEALHSGWWATVITDVSHLDRNEVSAGNHRISLGALRVIQ